MDEPTFLPVPQVGQPATLNPSPVHARPNRPGLSERAFRRFEAVIAEAINRYPEAVRITPEVMSCYTYTARLRDAILSYKRFNWPSVCNRNKFDEISESLVVRQEGDVVVVGPKKDVVNLAGTVVNPAIQDIDDACLEAVCLLLHNRHLNRFVIANNEVNFGRVCNLRDKYDVSFQETPTIITLL